VTWRDATTDARNVFRAGMARYAAQDYTDAVRDLERASSLSPEAPDAHFYLGICRLLAGDVERGAASLERTVSMGDTPFLESAHFYLAKAALMKNDRSEAEARLGRVIALRGDFESKARELSHEIEKISSESARPPSAYRPRPR
jgi:tetratricopeptide (TPR) repeat protein